MLDEHGDRQQRHPGQQRPGLVATNRGAQRADLARHRQHEQQRRGETDLAAEQFAQIASGARRMPVGGAAALLDEAGPAMRRVPVQHRQEQRQRQQRRQPGPGRPQPGAPRAGCQQPAGKSGAGEEGGVFAVQRRADRQPGRQPPGAARGRERARQCGQRQGPEEQQRRIGGHGHAADREQQGGVHRHAGDDCAFGAMIRTAEVGGRGGEQQRSGRGRERSEQTHPQRTVAAQPGAEPDPQRHHRRMVEIAGGQGPRPDPVV